MTATTPHPASRVDGEIAVVAGHTGEIYRCVAGTRMQVTVGEMVNGAASFDRGDTFSCAKGEALVHTRGGELQCRPQAPERDCNERSLLRKFGPGIKLVNMPSQKAICEPTRRQTVTKVVKEVKVPVPSPPAASSSMAAWGRATSALWSLAQLHNSKGCGGLRMRVM